MEKEDAGGVEDAEPEEHVDLGSLLLLESLIAILAAASFAARRMGKEAFPDTCDRCAPNLISSPGGEDNKALKLSLTCLLL